MASGKQEIIYQSSVIHFELIEQFTTDLSPIPHSPLPIPQKPSCDTTKG